MASLAALAAGGMLANLGALYWVSIAAVAFIYFRQQVLSRTEGEELQQSIGKVFYLNRFISPVIFSGMLLDAILKNFLY